MRINGIEIRDTFGTHQFRVGPFSVLRITGKNSSGKSSILRALGYLFSGGCDPSVVRKGTEQSVVEITLDGGVRIVKTTRPKRSRKGGEITGWVADLEITASDGSVISAPQSYINELGEALAIDPSILLRIDSSTVPGRRALAAELSKLIPISFSPEEVTEACSYRSTPETPTGTGDAVALASPVTAALSLDDLKKSAASVTEQRRREGQTRNDTDGAISRLQKALPESALAITERYQGSKQAKITDASLRQELEQAEEDRRAVETAIADAKLEIEKRKGVDVAATTATWSAAVAVINADIDAQIKALEAQRGERNSVARDERDKAKSAAETQAAADIAAVEAEAAPELAKAITTVTEGKDKIAAYARAATLREEIAIQENVHRASAWKYDQLSEVLQCIESLRLSKINDVPVQGFSWNDDGFPCLDGVDWANVNLARRVEAVLQICCLQTGKVPLIMIDDCEHLDSETHRLIDAGLVEAGYQVIEAQVKDCPELTIEVA